MPATHSLNILITSPEPNEVLVRWDKPLDRARCGRYALLESELEELHGVEAVSMKRYHATLEVNLDVTRIADVKEEVREVFEDFRVELHDRFLPIEVTVV